MCGRYSIAKEPKELERRFGAVVSEPLVPRYNAAPSQRMPVIFNTEPKKLQFVKWGMRPKWMKKDLINVRTETLRDKKTFQADLFNRRWKMLSTTKKALRVNTIALRVVSFFQIGSPQSVLNAVGIAGRLSGRN